MTKFTDLDDLDIQVPREDIFKCATDLMRHAIPLANVEEAFSYKVERGENMFSALVRAGKAKNFFDAAVMVGKRFPPEGGSSWSDLGKWVADYNAHEARKGQPT